MNRQEEVFPWHQWLPHTCELSLDDKPRQFFAVKSVLHLDDEYKPNLFVTCRFHRKVPIYAAGESISGTVYTFVDTAFPCKSVNIHLRGVCFIDLPPSHPKGSKCIELLHTDMFNAWTEDTLDEGEIDSGISKFKFSLQIPQKARATTLDRSVSVLYCVLVEFEAPYDCEYKNIMAFGGYVKIRSPPYIQEEILNSPRSCTDVLKVLGKDGLLKGQLNVDVQLPAQGAVFNTGQKINIDVKITQHYCSGSYKLEEVFPVLVQNIVFQSDPLVEFSRVVSPIEQCRNLTVRKKMRAHTYKFTLTVGDVIPSTHPSTVKDDLLSVSYHLQLLVKHEFSDTYHSICSRRVAIVDDLNICTDIDGKESYPSLHCDDDPSSEEEGEPLINVFDACFRAGKYGPEEDEVPEFFLGACNLLTISSNFMVELIYRYSFLILIDKKKPAWTKSPRARIEAEKEAEEFKKAVETAKQAEDYVEMGTKATLHIMGTWMSRKYITRRDCKEYRLFLKQNLQKMFGLKRWLSSEIESYLPVVNNLTIPSTCIPQNGLESETSNDLEKSPLKKNEKSSVALRKSRPASKISKKDEKKKAPSLTSIHSTQPLNHLVRQIWFNEDRKAMASNNTLSSFYVPFAVVTIFPSTIKSDLSHGVLFKYPSGITKNSSSSYKITAKVNGLVTEDTPLNEISPTRSSDCEGICAPSGLVEFDIMYDKSIRKIYRTPDLWNALQSNAVISVSDAYSNISDDLADIATLAREKPVRKKKHKKSLEKTFPDRNANQNTQIINISKSDAKSPNDGLPSSKRKTITKENVHRKLNKEQTSSKCNNLAVVVDVTSSLSDDQPLEKDCKTTVHQKANQSNPQPNDCECALQLNGSPTVTKDNPIESLDSDSSSSNTGSIDDLDTTSYKYLTSRDYITSGTTASDSEWSDSQKVFLDLDLTDSGKLLAESVFESKLSDKCVAGEKIEIRDNVNNKIKNNKFSSTNSKESTFGALKDFESKDHKTSKCKTHEMSPGLNTSSQNVDASGASTPHSFLLSSSVSQTCCRIYNDSWRISSKTGSEPQGKSTISCFQLSSSHEDTENTKTRINENSNGTNTKPKVTAVRVKNSPVAQRLLMLKTKFKNNSKDGAKLAVEESQLKESLSVKGYNNVTEVGSPTVKVNDSIKDGETLQSGQMVDSVKAVETLKEKVPDVVKDVDTQAMTTDDSVAGESQLVAELESSESADQVDKKEKFKISDRFLAMQSWQQWAKHESDTKTLVQDSIGTSVDINVNSDEMLSEKLKIHNTEKFQNSRSDIYEDISTKVDLSMVHKYSTKIFFEGPTSDGKWHATVQENPQLTVVTHGDTRKPESGRQFLSSEIERKRPVGSIQKSNWLECHVFEASLVESSKEINGHGKAVTGLNSLNRVHLEVSKNSRDSQKMELNPGSFKYQRDTDVNNQSGELSVSVSYYASNHSNGRITPQSGMCSLLEEWQEEIEQMFDPHSSDSPPLSYAVPRTVDSEGPFRVTRFEKEHERLWEVNVIGDMELQHTGIWSHKPLNTWTTLKFDDAAAVSMPNFERQLMGRSGPWRSKLNPRAPSFAGILSANKMT